MRVVTLDISICMVLVLNGNIIYSQTCHDVLKMKMTMMMCKRIKGWLSLEDYEVLFSMVYLDMMRISMVDGKNRKQI